MRAPVKIGSDPDARKHGHVTDKGGYMRRTSRTAVLAIVLAACTSSDRGLPTAPGDADPATAGKPAGITTTRLPTLGGAGAANRRERRTRVSRCGEMRWAVLLSDYPLTGSVPERRLWSPYVISIKASGTRSPPQRFAPTSQRLTLPRYN